MSSTDSCEDSEYGSEEEFIRTKNYVTKSGRRVVLDIVKNFRIIILTQII